MEPRPALFGDSAETGCAHAFAAAVQALCELDAAGRRALYLLCKRRATARGVREGARLEELDAPWRRWLQSKTI